MTVRAPINNRDAPTRPPPTLDESLSGLKVHAGEVTDVKGVTRVATLEDPERHLLMLRQGHKPGN